jgi:hypothetical protein
MDENSLSNKLSLFQLEGIRKKKTPWLESASELYQLTDRRLSAKLVSTFVSTGCHVVSVRIHTAVISVL